MGATVHHFSPTAPPPIGTEMCFKAGEGGFWGVVGGRGRKKEKQQCLTKQVKEEMERRMSVGRHRVTPAGEQRKCSHLGSQPLGGVMSRRALEALGTAEHVVRTSDNQGGGRRMGAKGDLDTKKQHQEGAPADGGQETAKDQKLSLNVVWWGEHCMVGESTRKISLGENPRPCNTLAV